MSAATTPRADAARLRAVIATLVRRFSLSERADVLCCGLTVAQAATLEALRQGPLRLGPLAGRLGITPSTLTRNLARLESEGLVAKEADPEDARASRVRLLTAGERAAAKVTGQELAFAEGILAKLGAQRRKEVMRALGELLAAVREATEECCPGAFDHLLEGVAAHGGARRKGRERKGCCGE
jgi:DNA-binding MarR family transcriptional regulator